MHRKETEPRLGARAREVCAKAGVTVKQGGLRMSARYHKSNDVTLRCAHTLTFLRTLPNEAVQLVVTSPPYNVGKEYEKRTSLDEYLDLQQRVIAECVRVTKPGGSICWQVGNRVSPKHGIVPLDIALHPLFDSHAESAGIRLRNRIVWHFEHGLHCRRRFSGRHETILWYTKGDGHCFNLDSVRVPQKYPGKRSYKGSNRGQYSGNPLGKNPGDFWVFPAARDSCDVWVFPNVKGRHIEKRKHPCQFPLELPARLISALSNPDDLVLDPFVGVGTTMAAAVLLGRRAAGVDYVRAYVEVARKRVRLAARGALKFRPIGKPVYVPADNTPLTTPPPGFLPPG